MNSSARDRIAERVKNAYAAGYEDARADRAGRMDEVAETETARVLGIVREALTDPVMFQQDFIDAVDMALYSIGADDDGGERAGNLTR